MKAVVCTELGPPEKLEIQEIELGEINDDQILVTVEAAGINFPDALLVQGKYQVLLDPPFIPGNEIAGIVKENVAATALGKLVFSGKVDISGWGSGSLTPGDRYFLNGDGLLSTAPPTGSGEFVTLVGEALDANTFAINIDTPVELS